MGKNIRRKKDKPRWSEETKIRNLIACIDRDDPKRENPNLQKERKKLSEKLQIMNGIW